MEASFGEFLPITNTDQNSVAEYLAKYLQGFNKVIWFDDHDSSGMLRTYIFPFIDNYTKSQLLINKKYYQEHHYFGVLHRDYVYGQIHTTENPTFKGVISDEFIQKLKVGWNTAFINWQYFNHHSPYIKELFLKNCRSNKITLTAPNLSKRNLHISYRASLWANYPSIGWWRTNTKNLIENYIKKNQQYYMNSFDKINKQEYLAEMKHSIICPSPFGMGEICYRDFECFMNGSLLLKPKMDHMETWPPLYTDNETYISHKWDFSDFEEKIDTIIGHPGAYEDIARIGQERFIKALSDGPGFVKYFKEMID